MVFNIFDFLIIEALKNEIISEKE